MIAAVADQPIAPAADVAYAYKASLIGAAHRFELTEQGVSWRTGRRTGLWTYRDIAAVRLSYRPVSMQARRFRCDLERRDGARLAIISTSWQTSALMAPQDADYRAFMIELHRRLAQAGSTATLSGGLRPRIYQASVALLTLVAAGMAALLVRALFTGEFAGALFLVGFAALFAWQVGGFIRRNRPRSYGFDALPVGLVP